MKKASAFAFQKKLTDGKYINYRKMMASIDGKVVYDFMHSVVDHIVMKYSYVKSIRFLNGVTVTFIYKEDSDTSQYRKERASDCLALFPISRHPAYFLDSSISCQL